MNNKSKKYKWNNIKLITVKKENKNFLNNRTTIKQKKNLYI